MAEQTPPLGQPPVLLPTRPLALGAFPLPFGYLLLPAGEECDSVRDGLLAGRLPEAWPELLRAHELAVAGDFDGAMAALTAQDPVSLFNRYVLDPDRADPAEVRAGLGVELAVLFDLVEFAIGRSDTAPDPDGLDGELAALALAAQAAAALDGTDPHGIEVAEPIALLERAITECASISPALAGVLHGAKALAHKQAGEPLSAVTELEAGIALLTGTDLNVACAEQHLELATTYHEQAGDHRELLHGAVHHYHCALQTITAQQAPEVFAAAHANLGSAYLTMPMVEASDHLRLGVAVGSLRAALTVYTQDTHPQQWSSAQLNLANALVYAPSTHQADNLVEAVELYEAVLTTRDRHSDPLGFARVLANQGNALAHLGMFEHARGKLVEARFLFEEFHEYDAVTSVRGVLDEIARQTTLQNSMAAAEA